MTYSSDLFFAEFKKINVNVSLDIEENIGVTLEVDMKAEPVTKGKWQPQKYIIVAT